MWVFLKRLHFPSPEYEHSQSSRSYVSENKVAVEVFKRLSIVAVRKHPYVSFSSELLKGCFV